MLKSLFSQGGFMSLNITTEGCSFEMRIIDLHLHAALLKQLNLNMFEMVY
jgi:hypothetical protein